MTGFESKMYFKSPCFPASKLSSHLGDRSPSAEVLTSGLLGIQPGRVVLLNEPNRSRLNVIAPKPRSSWAALYPEENTSISTCTIIERLPTKLPLESSVSGIGANVTGSNAAVGTASIWKFAPQASPLMYGTMIARPTTTMYLPHIAGPLFTRGFAGKNRLWLTGRGQNVLSRIGGR